MHPNEIKPLADAIYLDKVLRARRVPSGEKIGQALELYDSCVSWMKFGIQHESPEASPDRVQKLVRDRMRKTHYLSDFRVFRPLESST